MNKRKVICIAVAVITWVQIILVLLIDCTLFAWLAKYEFAADFDDSGDERGPFFDAVLYFYVYGKTNVILIWSIFQMILHTAWIASSCMLMVFAFKRNPKTYVHLMQYAIVTLLVCICDIGACIHTSVFSAENEYTDVFGSAPKLFFPLFYCKVGFFWMYNVTVAVLMIDRILKMRAKRKRNAIKQDIAYHHSFKEPMGRDNPAMTYQYQHQQMNNDLVDNFYNKSPIFPLEHPILPAIEGLPPIIQATNYSNAPPIKPPPYAEHVQKPSHPKFEVPVPEPDY